MTEVILTHLQEGTWYFCTKCIHKSCRKSTQNRKFIVSNEEKKEVIETNGPWCLWHTLPPFGPPCSFSPYLHFLLCLRTLAALRVYIDLSLRHSGGPEPCAPYANNNLCICHTRSLNIVSIREAYSCLQFLCQSRRKFSKGMSLFPRW